MRLRWRRRRREAELEEEIASHLAMAARDHEAQGEAADEARYAARREFGNATLVREVTRKMWRGGWLADLGQELNFALRSIRRAPGFTLSVVTVLGLGLGAAAAMYGILDRLLLRPPDQVRDPDHLHAFYVTHATARGGDVTRGTFSWREAHLLADGNSYVTRWALFSAPSNTDITIGDQRLTIRESAASAGYFEVLGVRPYRGRFFEPDDSSAAAPPVAVIGQGFWRRQFGSSPSVLGRTLQVGDRLYTIVGVAPPGFSGITPEMVDLWVPADHVMDEERRDIGYYWQVLARTAGASDQAASTALLRLQNAPVLPRTPAYRYRDVRLASVIPGRAPVSPTTALRLSYLVGGGAALMALIALANAAGLLMLRALRQRRVTALRLVLGAGRGRLFRTVAVENLLLALLAGGASCLVAEVSGKALLRLLVRTEWAVPIVDLRVSLLTVAAALVAGGAAAVALGWSAGRPGSIAALKGAALDHARTSRPLRAALLVFQGALTIVLVAGLALFARSFQRARAFDFGPDVDHLLVAQLQEIRPTDPMRYAPVPASVTAEAIRRVGLLRGVEAVAATNVAPLLGFATMVMRAEGADSLPPGQFVTYVAASPSYFAATGIGVLHGRLFTNESAGRASEAVVSERMAAVLWPHAQALGRCLYIGQYMGRGPEPCTRVVGVVQDVRMSLMAAQGMLTFYMPMSLTAESPDARWLIVRAPSPSALVPAVRRIVAEVADVHGSDAVRTLRDVVDPQYRQLRQGMALFGIFAALAVAVAMIGMYSVVAYSVAQRSHEFGIRVALGAGAGNLARIVVRQALTYAALGLALGVVLALLGARYIAAVLYRTSPRDPVALAAAALALVVAALAACVVPARAAGRADPRQALQAE